MQIEISQISPPRKLSGLTSYLVSFPYHPDLVNLIKQISPIVYHKKDQCWEIPENELHTVLDYFTYYGDIKLNLLSKVSTPNIDDDAECLSESEINAFKVKPFKHQIEAINYGLKHKSWLLLDSPGLGKTNEIIWLAETLKRRGKLNHCMIIVGVNSLKQNWKKEIKKFSTESSIVIGEKISKKGKISYAPVKDRAIQLKNEISEFFIILNVESLRSDEIVDAINNSKNNIGMIAFDEIHRGVANKSSQQATNLLKISAPYMIGATGTLLVNSPISAYVSLSWTKNDHATLTNFKEQYCTFGSNQFTKYQVTGYKNLDVLKDELDSCSLRRTKDQLEGLPPKTVTLEVLEMNDEHAKFYEAIKQGVKEEADKINLNASNLLALTTRLRQATACPGILTSKNIISTKVERCVELVEDLVEQGEKVVIMSTYKPPIYQLQHLLAKYSPLLGTGDQPDIEVSTNVEKFQTDPDSKVFIGTTAKCATGLTLNAAAYMICLDCTWTSAMNNQCFDRIHRADNTRPAFITVLACENTIDQKVWDVAQYKQDLSDFVIDNIENSLSDSLKSEMYKIIKDL